MAVRWMTIALAVLLVSIALIEGNKKTKTIANGKVEKNRVTCDPGFLYSNENSKYSQEAKCIQTLWTGEETKNSSASDGIILPRIPEVGWALCINATPPEGDFEFWVKLFFKTNPGIIYVLGIHSKYWKIRQYIDVTKVVKLTNWTGHNGTVEIIPSPFPIKSGHNFCLRLEATTYHTLEFHWGHWQGSYAMELPINDINSVSAEGVGDFNITAINVWCQ